MTAALEEYIWKRQVEAFLALEGTIDYREDYDYKAERKKATQRLVVDEAHAAAG